MRIFDLFSTREKKKKQAGSADVYQYDTLPPEFRAQVIHLLIDSIGKYVESTNGYMAMSYDHRLPNKCWDLIHSTMCRELGVFRIGTAHANNIQQCLEYLQNSDTEGALNIIDLAFNVLISSYGQAAHWRMREEYEIELTPEEAIEQLNYRFRSHGIGYQFEGGELIRVDSQFIHADIVKPAITLLNEAGFQGPSQEFLKAHEHYRNKRNKEAIVEALKAFESTMKTICGKKGWAFSPNATAKDLIDVIVKNELVPASLTNHFTGLRTTLEGGLPTVRNKTSGHGQGAVPLAVPSYFVSYALHLAATNIVFLMEAYQDSN